MRIIPVTSDQDWATALDAAIHALEWGGTVVYPTDAFYALGANALNPVAVRKLFRIKARSNEKTTPILARNLMWARELARIEGRNKAIVNAVWPGPVTVILEKKDIVPDAVSNGTATVGIRVADHPFVNALLDRFGYPITAISASISGSRELRDSAEIITEFEHAGEKPTLIIDAGPLPPAPPSTVLDISGEKPKILRVGATRPEELMKILEL